MLFLLRIVCVVCHRTCIHFLLRFIPIPLSPYFLLMASDVALSVILVGICMVMFVPIVVRVGLVGSIVVVLISLGLLPRMVLAPSVWPMFSAMPVLTFWVLVVGRFVLFGCVVLLHQRMILFCCPRVSVCVSSSESLLLW